MVPISWQEKGDCSDWGDRGPKEQVLENREIREVQGGRVKVNKL